MFINRYGRKNCHELFLIISLFRECFFNLDSQKVCCTTNSYKKQARKEAAIIALEKLRKCCYTVKVKEKQMYLYLDRDIFKKIS